MDKRKAEFIYWVLTSKSNFVIHHENDLEYHSVKKERVKIANRYNELKAHHSYIDAERMAVIEWLAELEI